ncbi:MAG: signal peptidase I [bacterium]|nr:signal peptidase I [bacterium]
MNKKKIIQYLKYIVLNITVAALISLLLINYVASAYKIRGHSMYSELWDQDRIIISKLAIRTGSIERFDIVVLRKPNNPKKSIIKRVIGLPGETVEIREGDVYINSKKLKQRFLNENKNFPYRPDNMRPQKLREDYYFVMGDNRAVSHDSRSFGPVPRKYIYGITIFRYWPLSRLGKVE